MTVFMKISIILPYAADRWIYFWLVPKLKQSLAYFIPNLATVYTTAVWLNQVLQGRIDMPNPVYTFLCNLTQSITYRKSFLTFFNIINNCYRVNYCVTPIKRYGSEQPINPPFRKVVTINFSVAASKKVSSKSNIACMLLQRNDEVIIVKSAKQKILLVKRNNWY